MPISGRFRITSIALPTHIEAIRPQNSHHGVGRDAQRQHGDERGLRAGVVGRLGAGHAADVALAEAAVLAGELLLERVGRERRQQRAATGQHAQDGAQRRAADHRRPGLLEVLLGGPQALHVVREHLAVLGRLAEVGDDLAEAEQAHGDHHEADAVGEFRDVEAVAGRARDHVGVDLRQHQAQQDHRDGLQQRARGQHHRADQPQHHQREVFLRAELEGQLSERRREGSDDDRAHTAGEERAQAGSGECRARTALAGHLVAVDGRHHRGRFARHVDQDGGGGTAVLRAVIDAGQHDERRRGIEPVDGGQQHRDGGDRAEARQHADERPEHAAQERVQQVLQREGDAEAQRQVVDQFHGRPLFSWGSLRLTTAGRSATSGS
jgi:hypothetical protein